MIYSHAPWAKSGYGQIVKGLIENLPRHEYIVVAIDYQNSPLKYGNIPVVPCMHYVQESPRDLYHWVGIYKPDIILQLFDAWVIGRQWIKPDGPPVICYDPVDCCPVAEAFKISTHGAALHLAMSKYACGEFQKENIHPYKYLPHSIDTSFFIPPDDKKALKRMYGFSHDTFIWGIVGTNLTQRKNIPNQLVAFKKFITAHPEIPTKLYLHTNTKKTLDTSYNLNGFINRLALEGSVATVDLAKYITKDIEEETMVKLYGCMDVLLECSLGEGFGIPIIEAQSCGVPTIVSDFSAMPDVAGKGGLLVSEGEPVPTTDTTAWQFQPSTDAITRAMERIYFDKNLYKKLAKKARENAKGYDWKVWTPTWENTFKHVQKVWMRDHRKL